VGEHPTPHTPLWRQLMLYPCGAAGLLAARPHVDFGFSACSSEDTTRGLLAQPRLLLSRVCLCCVPARRFGGADLIYWQVRVVAADGVSTPCLCRKGEDEDDEEDEDSEGEPEVIESSKQIPTYFPSVSRPHARSYAPL